MPKKTVMDFLTAVTTDETLASQVAELAGKAGFPFSAEDLLELGRARPLSDEEAAGAAGGGASPWSTIHKSELAGGPVKTRGQELRDLKQESASRG